MRPPRPQETPEETTDPIRARELEEAHEPEQQPKAPDPILAALGGIRVTEHTFSWLTISYDGGLTRRQLTVTWHPVTGIAMDVRPDPDEPIEHKRALFSEQGIPYIVQEEGMSVSDVLAAIEEAKRGLDGR